MIYLMMLSHWFADFVCQTDKMATQKSKSNYWLGLHILTYTAAMTPFAVYAFGKYGFYFAIANGIAHFCVDYCTSRMTSKLWAKGDVHNFFVVIGLDQFLHFATLLATFTWWSAGLV